jgi:Lon protease-like protein
VIDANSAMGLTLMELPLFPLNTVVFPGWPMPLHIFEPRYLEMVKLCTENQSPFGIVLIKKGSDENDPVVEPYDIGCTVKITQTEEIRDGRILIMTIGQERFRILSLNHDKPYLTGEVEKLPFRQEKPEPLREAAHQLHGLLVDYLNQLAQFSDEIKFDTARVPTDPEELGFTASALLQAPLETKQSLLEARKASSLLKYLYGVYQQEIELLRRFPKQDMGIFSVN